MLKRRFVLEPISSSQLVRRARSVRRFGTARGAERRKHLCKLAEGKAAASASLLVMGELDAGQEIIVHLS